MKKMFTATISKAFTFDAAHHIDTFPEGHRCRRVHGHTYKVEVILRHEVDPDQGFFIDYGEIMEAFLPVHAQLDHRDLNEVLTAPPTTENLAVFIIRELLPLLPQLTMVRVHESSTTYCELAVVDLRAAGVIPLPPRPRSQTRERVTIPHKR